MWGAYYGPASAEINEGQIAGNIEIMPEVSQSRRVNTIKSTFVDPQQNYAEADFPVVAVSEWVAEDGVEISQNLKLRFVTSEFQSQRLADIRLKRTRISRTMNIPLNLSGYRYRPGMYVKVNLPSLGIVGVEMRVTDWKFGINNGVQITFKQETADVWGDAIGKSIERPPFTQLPNSGVAQPQNLKYKVEEIGQVVQGVLSWQNVGQFVYNKVVIRRAGQMVLSAQVPGSFTRLAGLPRNTYTAHVTAVNQMGAESPEAYLEFNIQAPPAPSAVAVEQGYFSVTLRPRLAAIVNISTQFDFWITGISRDQYLVFAKWSADSVVVDFDGYTVSAVVERDGENVPATVTLQIAIFASGVSPSPGTGLNIFNATGACVFSTTKRSFVYRNATYAPSWSWTDIGNTMIMLGRYGDDSSLSGGWDYIKWAGLVRSGNSVRCGKGKVSSWTANYPVTGRRLTALSIPCVDAMY